MSYWTVTASLRKALSTRRLRRYFAGSMFGGSFHPTTRLVYPRARAPEAAEGIFACQSRQFVTAQVIVRCFYGIVLYYAVLECADFSYLASRMNFTPLWPVAWISLLPGFRPTAVLVVLALYGATSVLGAFFCQHRMARLLAGAGVLEYFSYRNSFGKIGHGMHLFVAVTLLLIFLPNGWHRPAALVSRRTRDTTLLVFWLCQASLLLSYSMAGLDKLIAAIYQLADGQMSAFSPGAFGAHIANRLVQTHSESLLGGAIIDHPHLTWPLMPLAIYLECFAFWIAFRPALQRWWALALILFHIGTIFTLTVTFPMACLLLALFFFQSPFAPTAVSLRQMLVSVPLASEVLNLPAALRRGNSLPRLTR